MMRVCSLFVLLMAAIIQPAHAAEVKSGAISIQDPWARATPAAAKAGGAFMTLTNRGGGADKLVSAAAEIAERTELHATVEEAGVMKMREVEGGVALPPRQTVEFRPGGYHVMLMGLKRPLAAGQTFPLTLTFQNAGVVQVAIEVKPANYAPAGAAHGQASHHGKH